ncbi:NAD(P)H dehydrogenase (quinone) [Chitinophaga jiangningensis]|uniref:NAD(P)H dehydrogenase (Quinone) n=1 Tax=Chitinophaga jiangningensis TaxID=1419482 RepID=A0A1M7CP19_9BACT|nr:NAD(P)H-dependent oxidoreductase [Chitinophaga jiangningensis]SHL69004.1 NAD(P)H dehydrogenase (quinone) [Chitinophaga jiangningensis]
MNILIVFAHPEPRSLNGTLKNAAVSFLEATGHQVIVSDLYQQKWKSQADGGDFLQYTPDQRLIVAQAAKEAYHQQLQSPDITAEQEKVMWADLVIYQFPLWWFTMPAILKGWFDRVYTNGFGYGTGQRYGGGKLAGKKGMLLITTGGDFNTFTDSGIHGNINDLLFPIHHGIMWYTGMAALPPFLVHSANHISEADVDKSITALKERLSTLETTDTIPYYSVPNGDYDEHSLLKAHLHLPTSTLNTHTRLH